jgi:uncharacterized membrane protein YhaH (DUF805 family)
MPPRYVLEASHRVSGPAISLMSCAAFCILLLVIGLVFDAWLMLSGEVRNVGPRRGIPHETAVLVRVGWGAVMVLVNVFVLVGAAQMRRLRSRGLAMTACVLAVIPCLGPCFLLGLPFGVWGLVALNDHDVRRAFRRRDEW